MPSFNLSICIAFSFAGLLWLYKPVNAQQQIMGTSTHPHDIKSLFANPALISFQQPRFGTGIKAYHAGLTDAAGSPLTQGFATLSTPFIFGDHLGAGVNIQYFNSPIFKRANFSLATSVRLFRYVSIGGQITGLNITYNSENFELEDRYDPVFQEGLGKTTLNSSIGLYSQPANYLSLSLGIRSLNEPNISLIGSDVKEPREYYAGLSLVHGAYRSSFEIIRGRHDLDGMFYFEAFSGTGDYVRAGSNYYLDQGIAEGQLHITGPLSVNYQFTLPFSTLLGPSRGSHMFSLIFEFNRVSRIPDRVTPPRSRMTLEQPEIIPDVKRRVYISPENDTLKIFQKEINREIDPGMSDEILANVSLYDLSEPDSSFLTEYTGYPAEQYISVPDQVESGELISREYNRFLQNIGRGNLGVISVITDTSHIMRAAGLRSRILHEARMSEEDVPLGVLRFESDEDSLMYYTPVQRDQIPPFEQITITEPQELKLNLYSSTRTTPARSWRLAIKDSEEVLVRTLSGSGDIPSELTWDWLDESGNIIAPGIYFCRLYWETEGGSTQTSGERALYVQMIHRNVTIRVTDNPAMIPVHPDRIRILIKN